MPKIDRDGVKLYYEVHGSGPALILTHGYSSTSAMWEGQNLDSAETREAAAEAQRVAVEATLTAIAEQADTDSPAVDADTAP